VEEVFDPSYHFTGLTFIHNAYCTYDYLINVLISKNECRQSYSLTADTTEMYVFKTSGDRLIWTFGMNLAHP
jgi:hypothetical protein